MKKIFSIISACIVSLILVFMLVLCFVKKNVYISYGTPEKIYVYNKSSTVTHTFDNTNKEFDEILKRLKKMTSISLFNRLIKLKTLQTNVNQDLDGKYETWNTSIEKDNLVIELYFGTNLQDSIVYYNGNSKVVSYYYLAYVIPTDGNLNEMAVYMCDTTSSTSTTKDTNYKNHKPLIITGYTKDIKSFVNGL